MFATPLKTYIPGKSKSVDIAKSTICYIGFSNIDVYLLYSALGFADRT